MSPGHELYQGGLEHAKRHSAPSATLESSDMPKPMAIRLKVYVDVLTAERLELIRRRAKEAP